MTLSYRSHSSISSRYTPKFFCNEFKAAINIQLFMLILFQYIEWSPDSEYILCASLKKAIVQVFSICYPDWKCKLTEGSAGLEQVTWSPDSRHIITTGDFNVRKVSVFKQTNITNTLHLFRSKYRYGLWRTDRSTIYRASNHLAVKR